MFSLIPWKKRTSNIPVRHKETESAYGQYDPLLPVSRMREEFGTLMDRFFGDRFLSEWPDFGQLGEWPTANWNWDLGLEDRDSEYVAHAELPGFEPDEIDVAVTNDRLTVRAEHKDEKKEKNGSSYRYGSFVRTMTLPQGVDTGSIDAKYHSGVLEVHLPKTESAQAKRIEVKTL